MEILQNIHPLLGMIILTFLPFIEARYSIPFGIVFYNLSPITAFSYGVVISLPIILFIIFFLNKIVPLIKWKWFNKIKDKIFEYTRKKHTKVFDQAATISLITFIAIPLPGTGVYSGSLLCYLIGFSAKRSFLIATTGMLIAAALMTFFGVGFEAAVEAISN